MSDFYDAIKYMMSMDLAKPGTDMTSISTLMNMAAARTPPAVFIPPKQKTKPGKPITPEPTKYLVWSPGFGLRFEEDKGQFAPGTYKRIKRVYSLPPGSGDKWYLLIRRKDMHGRNGKLDWIEVSKDQLPKQIQVEALLQDIVL